jgi:hypothetical protein
MRGKKQVSTEVFSSSAQAMNIYNNYLQKMPMKQGMTPE